MEKRFYKKAAAGDSEALSSLYAEKAGKIYLVSRLLTGFDNGALKTAKDSWTALLGEIKSQNIKDDAEFDEKAMEVVSSLSAELTRKTNAKAFSYASAAPSSDDGPGSDVFSGDTASGMRYVAEALSGVKPADRFAAVLSLFGMTAAQIAEITKLDESAVPSAAAGGLNLLCSNLEAAGKRKYSIDIPKRSQLKDLFTKALTSYKAPENVMKACIAPIQDYSSKNNNNKFVILVGVIGLLIAAFFLVKIFSGKAPENEEAAISGEVLATIEVENYGTVKLKLEPSKAPETVANFVSLAESGFYDGLTFHRIMEGFMIQGGDPDGNGTGGSGKTIKGEFAANGVENDLSHTRGAVSMARNSISMDSASSQFFIVQDDSTFLDGQYACFGYVTEGMEVVDAIAADAQPIDNNGTIPADQQPVITSITIEK